ncbi:MAG: hypothetical protein U5L46_16330 [Agrobacterium sp.]|nr:hypothetical protein [Agrobacterium sp.]
MRVPRTECAGGFVRISFDMPPLHVIVEQPTDIALFRLHPETEMPLLQASRS